MPKQAILRSVVSEYLRSDLPDIAPGDTVRAHVRVSEGGKERIQIFEGTVLGLRGGGIAESVILRKISNGVGVERTFPLHSPMVAKFEVTRKGRVRRAKLFYLRDKVGKESRIREKRTG